MSIPPSLIRAKKADYVTRLFRYSRFARDEADCTAGLGFESGIVELCAKSDDDDYVG